MSEASIRTERTARDEFMRAHYASPIPEEHQAAFTGLDYFDHDDAWRLPVDLVLSDPVKLRVPSTAGTDSPYTKLATARCAIGGSTYSLIVLDDGDGGAFIPFRDSTAGIETYSGGRYVPIDLSHEPSIVDFNRSHNPYCVYDEEFTCPLPPPSQLDRHPDPSW